MGEESIWDKTTYQSFEKEEVSNLLHGILPVFCTFLLNMALTTFYRSNKESEPDLLAIISQRRSERKGQFDSMFSSLVSKYGGNSSVSEPTEEEFEAAQKKIESRRTSKKSRRK